MSNLFDNTVPNLSGLKGFTSVTPRNTKIYHYKCQMTLSDKLILPNIRCYRTFNGNKYIRFAIAKNHRAVALIPSNKDDSKAFTFRHEHTRKKKKADSYQPFMSKSTIMYLNSILPDLDLEHYRYHVRAEEKDITPNYIIFHLDHNHVSNITLNKRTSDLLSK